MAKQLMSGNEAIARGAYEYGVRVAAAYPGTPSTEILENISKYKDTIYSEWSPNEKVSLEVGIGASIGGARALVAMKHVGLNVAADPLMTVTYSGVTGGLVIISADDPGMHSSQNEQDNRFFAKFAKIPLLEPSNSQEAKEMVGLALEISEQFDTPVLLRTTTRISHSLSLVEINDRVEVPVKPYEKNDKKYVMVPAFARQRRLVIEDRLRKLEEYSETTPVNHIEWKDKKIGVITSGVSYQYAREALPEASILKLGFSYPLPKNMIQEFASQVDELYIIEELEPFMEEQIRAMGVNVKGKDVLPNIGELSVQILRQRILGESIANLEAAAAVAENLATEPAPMRPPVLCPGCPHRGVFFTLKKMKLVVSGDIGCYTLGALAPLNAMDTTICMGYSIGGAHGMELANPDFKGKTVAVIGDSTFLHTGVNGLMDIVYNGSQTTTLILDNRTTAMTGQQHNPCSGKTLMGDDAREVNLELLCKAIGVERVFKAHPFDLTQLQNLISQELAVGEPSVIIVEHPCIFVDTNKYEPVTINENCKTCKVCMQIGCPAIVLKDGKIQINQTLCYGCDLCSNVCNFDAIDKGSCGTGGCC
ncbi:indolepyruvate ferredoxin oxidoreductase subunit alpha [Desulfuribacillus stibiiarsenatis]|uniref:Indolepyruvate oxidoreductase subunit IorA n=1 Tax=Desulfuribacillus stibiiarsenatis TaxID=1390249 RepID=A0A1E5LA99_9FIRM|nr:indolepyruvate ferredoxin oxidoreductase subunit alpha [Desulfuribacillus stibiiarsenatis]OEH86949.1 indolepyruvate ferredoxin oxidoreductase subunit alpha [Desulfuribacillus stibiiarsenatis]